LESEYSSSQESLNHEKAVFDSLQSIFEARIKEIDSEKEKSESNESKIINLMAQSVTLSNQLEQQQQRVDALIRQIDDYESRLYYKYSEILDSLRTNQTANNIEKKENSKNLILYYTEKKIEVSPKLHSLSFDPKRILQFDIKRDEQGDAIDSVIYRQYLQSALFEVESQLQKVDTLIIEIERMRQLQTKASNFIDEMAMENEMRPYAILNKGTESVQSDRTSEMFDNKAVILPQAESYVILLRQLSWNQASDNKFKWQSPLDSLKFNISIDDYVELLHELAKGLTEYQFVLNKKISRLN
jgi:hypothetical protein